MAKYDLQKVSKDLMRSLFAARKGRFSFPRWLRKLNKPEFDQLDWMLEESLKNPDGNEAYVFSSFFTAVMDGYGYDPDSSVIKKEANDWYNQFLKCIAMEYLARKKYVTFRSVVFALPLQSDIVFTEEGESYVSENNLDHSVIAVYLHLKSLNDS